MTPTAPELLTGCVAALSTPPVAEHGGAYMAGTLSVAAILNLLAAQECATGAAVRVWENAAIRALFAETGAAYDSTLDGALSTAGEVSDGDFSLATLDFANAELRRRLIRLHEAVESRNDTAIDLRILRLYGEMAAHRLLELPI